jgi:hypothetical protein
VGIEAEAGIVSVTRVDLARGVAALGGAEEPTSTRSASSAGITAGNSADALRCNIFNIASAPEENAN